jgi:hypothetical protein
MCLLHCLLGLVVILVRIGCPALALLTQEPAVPALAHLAEGLAVVPATAFAQVAVEEAAGNVVPPETALVQPLQHFHGHT